MTATGHCGVPVLLGKFSEPSQGGDDSAANEFKASLDLQLLDVLGEIARGHPLVNVFVTCQRAELFYAGFHIVTGHLFPVGNRGEVDLRYCCGVRLDHTVGHIDAEVFLRLQHGDPQLSFEHDLGFGRPDTNHSNAGVSIGKNVRQCHHSSVSRLLFGRGFVVLV